MPTVQAVFENGVFRPTGPVGLPEHCRVEFEPRVVGPSDDPGHRERVAKLLSQRFRSGQSDIAARHNDYRA